SHSCSRHLRHLACHSPLSLLILIPYQDTSGLAPRSAARAALGFKGNKDVVPNTLQTATLQFLLANQPTLPLLYIDTVNRNTTSKKA
ncbi:hypothetical protein ACI2KG_25855, partial [Pseudomonas sp. NPDC089407]|uniref:hypothetical protein n=1 Tax=Pseudomonas sp. NPDC089407 TaxID=3364464 RepID=UPI00384DE3B9